MVNIAAFSTRPDLEDTVFDGPWVSVADDTEFSKVFGQWEPEVKALVHVGNLDAYFYRGTYIDLRVSVLKIQSVDGLSTRSGRSLRFSLAA